MNDINFPAGILQPPFYDFSKDAAVNFGGIGVVIGHEMTHGFDDQGSKYDGHGNVVEWQTPADRKAFTERTDCEVKEYGNFEAVPGVKLNGNLTLGENTADNGGLRLAYMALMDTLAKRARRRRRSMAIRRRSGSSLPSASCGARTCASRQRATVPWWIRTPRADGG